jgi:hypothetical protein
LALRSSVRRFGSTVVDRRRASAESVPVWSPAASRAVFAKVTVTVAVVPFGTTISFPTPPPSGWKALPPQLSPTGARRWSIVAVLDGLSR